MHTGSEPLDDLVQVAQLGIVKAADRFDPAFGVEFRTFAALTARGELRRHYRDATWSIRVPRRLQELRYEIRAAVDVLQERHGRAPSTADIATYLLVTPDDVIDALCADSNFRAKSLDDLQEASGHEVPDPSVSSFDDVESSDAFGQLVSKLPERLQRVVTMRFVEQLRRPRHRRPARRQPGPGQPPAASGPRDAASRGGGAPVTARAAPGPRRSARRRDVLVRPLLGRSVVDEHVRPAVGVDLDRWRVPDHAGDGRPAGARDQHALAVVHGAQRRTAEHTDGPGDRRRRRWANGHVSGSRRGRRASCGGSGGCDPQLVDQLGA